MFLTSCPMLPMLQVQRQVASMRAGPPGVRNMVQEAAAAASAK